MVDTAKNVKTQWNRYVRPFSVRSENEIDELLRYCSETAALAEQLSGCDCFLAYGGLLGFARSGKLISHDFDIDIAINFGNSDQHSVAQSCLKLIEKFLDLGYRVKAKSFGQFFILPPGDSHLKVEFFSSWIENEKYYLYFAVPGAPIATSIVEREEIFLHGHKFMAPKEASYLLEATYGPDWRIPNPDFNYNMDPKKWAPFQSFFSNRNRHYWEKYYMNGKAEAGSVNEEILDSLIETVAPTSKILDIGCGVNGYAGELSTHCQSVIAVDYSETAIDEMKFSNTNDTENVAYEALNLYNIPECEEFASKNKFDILFSINTLDVVSTVGELSFWRLARGVVEEGGKLILYVPTERIVENSGDERELSSNAMEKISSYRRYINLENLCKRAGESGFRLQSSSTKAGSVLLEFNSIGCSELEIIDSLVCLSA